jgi:hypothetical protein
MKRLLGEFLTIVLGVLVALGVDEWRQGRSELKIAGEHLADITAELRQNLCTVERIRVRHLPRKMENLQTVLNFLNDPQAETADPAALLHALARSTSAARPWLVDNQYQALQNSGNVRLVHKLQPDLVLSSVYEGPEVLFSQEQRIQGPYPVVVNELLPAQLQSQFSQLRGYARGAEAPVLVDDADLAKAVDAVRARRVELLGLARNEAAVAMGRWYALTRISDDLRATLEELERWDRSTMPLEKQLEECRAPRPDPSKPPASK